MTWIIANPSAGAGRAKERAKVAAISIQKQFKTAELHFTKSRGDAFKIAKLAVSKGIKNVIVCGGDGTLHETLPALSNTNTTLGILPFGSCNDFARHLRIPRTTKAAIECCLNGEIKEIDLGTCNSRLFATVAAIGFDAEVNKIVEKTKTKKRITTYISAALKHLRDYKPREMSLHGDFGNISVVATMVTCANTHSYGGGLNIAPHAIADDGMFDICILSASGKLHVLILLIFLLTGNHTKHPNVRLERSSFLEIESESETTYFLDGEYSNSLPVRFDIVPKALKVIVPI